MKTAAEVADTGTNVGTASDPKIYPPQQCNGGMQPVESRGHGGELGVVSSNSLQYLNLKLLEQNIWRP